MKKTPTPTTSNHTSSLNSDLPIIRIVSEEEEMHVKMGLEMDDKTRNMLVKIGKEVASDEDYVEIAVRAGLKHGISSDK